MSRTLLALNLFACLSIFLVSMFPSVLAYQVDYDSCRQIFSGSMLPVLEVLDFVYVKNVSGQTEVHASYDDGDIILFQSPYQPSELIVHRAVEKFQSDSTWYFKTKGDNNPSLDAWVVSESDVIGKIVALLRMETVDSCNVTVFSNSAFVDFHLNLSLNALEVDVTVLLTQSVPNSFLNITIPNELITGELDVLVDDSSILFEHSINSTHHFVWFDREGTDYRADIVLPELSQLFILPFFMLMTLATILTCRKYFQK